MKKHSTRTGYTFTIEDGEAVLTIIKPISGEHENQYITLVEDAHGRVDVNFLTKKEIMEIYKLKDINLDEIL